MRLLIIDNYDSFTYNLVELVRQTTDIPFDVYFNDNIDIQAVDNYQKILISPGPGLPEEAGLSCDIIRKYSHSKEILGICLGHQAIATVFGGSLYHLPDVYHGLEEEIQITEPVCPLFEDIPLPFKAALYHSWAVSTRDLPDCLSPVAFSGHGILMGLKHNKFDVYGLQFHPESVMTPYGFQIMYNWLKR